ncbi:hypothetical protein LTR94_032454, partial [Friedmanniomyces endolithicus]
PQLTFRVLHALDVGHDGPTSCERRDYEILDRRRRLARAWGPGDDDQGHRSAYDRDAADDETNDQPADRQDDTAAEQRPEPQPEGSDVPDRQRTIEQERRQPGQVEQRPKQARNTSDQDTD